MRASTRTRSIEQPSGTTGTARVGRRVRDLAGRIAPGDVVVLDHADLDRASAQVLVDAEVAAVVNATRFVSGRYPPLGPELLASAGVGMVDGIGAAGLAAVRDGARVRVDNGAVHLGDGQVVRGRDVPPSLVELETRAARAGMTSQLETLTHNAAEMLRREQDLLLHGRGVPRVSAPMTDRSVVVAVEGHGWESELAAVTTFVREQQPVLVAVDGAADALREAGLRPAVVVVDGRSGAELPSGKTLKAASDVVVVVDPGTGRTAVEALERMGIRPVRFETSVTTEDAALLLADAADAALVVGVGLHATLAELLDRERGGLASTYLTRLKLGPRLVDADAVPRLYAGRVRPHHLFLVMLAGLVALTIAVGTTPVGQEWFDTWGRWLTDLGHRAADLGQGLFS